MSIVQPMKHCQYPFPKTTSIPHSLQFICSRWKVTIESLFIVTRNIPLSDPNFLITQELKLQTSPYQVGSHGILIIAIHVTLSVIGNNDAGHFAIHPKMRISIAHEHQQLHGIVPPANPVLRWDGHFQKVGTKWHSSTKAKTEKDFKGVSGKRLTPHTAACMMASKPPSGTSMFADTCCFETISLNLSVLLVNDRRCLYPNVGGHSWSTLLQKIKVIKMGFYCLKEFIIHFLMEDDVTHWSQCS